MNDGLTGFYAVARATVRAMFQVWCGFRVVGIEHVPLEGPLIVACNHVAYLDPPALGSALPRRLSYMAKLELFQVPVLGPTIAALHAFPVDRSKGDIAAIKQSVKTLRTGAAVGIFPEGGRNPQGDPDRRKSGVALLAHLSGAPVLPAYVGGTHQARFRRPITVVFGPPVKFASPEKARREDLSKWTDEIMSQIAALGETIRGN